MRAAGGFPPAARASTHYGETALERWTGQPVAAIFESTFPLRAHPRRSRRCEFRGLSALPHPAMTQPSTSEPNPGYDAPPPAASAKPEKASLFDDFLDIFYAPSAVFARRENASFWIPLLIVTVLLGLTFFANRDLMAPMMEAEMERSMAASGQQLTPEQMEAARRFTTGLGAVSAFIFPPIAILMIGIVLWLVGKFFDAHQTMNAAIVVAAFAYVPRVVEGIVTRVQGLMVDPSTLDHRYSLSLGPGRFLDPDTSSPLLIAIVGRLDVFTLWVTVLLAIGLAVTGKISRGKAAIAAAVVWVVGALPTIAAALRQ
jgi:hypothetical protein